VEKKQKLEDLLVPVNPIEVMNFSMPSLVYKTTCLNIQDSLVYSVEARYYKKHFKGMHPDPHQAKLKTAQKILDAYIKNSFARTIITDLKGQLHQVLTKNKKYINTYIIGQQTIYSYKKEKERLVYTFYQLHPASGKIKFIKGNRAGLVSWTAISKLHVLRNTLMI